MEHLGPGEALQLECENLRQQVVEARHGGMLGDDLRLDMVELCQLF